MLLFIATLYHFELTEPFVEANHMVLAHLDAQIAMRAAHRLCARDSAFPPRAGEIVAECARLDPSTPPPLDVATGYYLDRRWDAHPLVQQVAESVYWDHRTSDGRREFRDKYVAALHDHQQESIPVISAAYMRELQQGDDSTYRRVM